MKNWRTRLQETWDKIDSIHGVPVVKVNALKAYHDGMTTPKRGKLVKQWHRVPTRMQNPVFSPGGMLEPRCITIEPQRKIEGRIVGP